VAHPQSPLSASKVPLERAERGNLNGFDSAPPLALSDADGDEVTVGLELPGKAVLRRLRRLHRAMNQGWFYRARLTLLLTILAAVLLWAGSDYVGRRERTAWHRPVKVALVLALREPVSQHTLELLSDRTLELERRLGEEYRRYTGRDFTPFSVTVKGPVGESAAPPRDDDDGVVDLFKHSARMWWWSRGLDSQANVEWMHYDSRIYLVLKPTSSAGIAFVEGESEAGGRLGVAQADIDPEMVDFSLFVAAHELLHTLGASDKYGTSGRAIYPFGYADPNRSPLYPQPGAEVMARNVPVGPLRERPPASLDELYVGETTAREIGWIR
jgi:hypothetical protein